MYFPNSDKGYAVGYNGIICRTTDAGANWQQQSGGMGHVLNSVFFPKPDIGFAVGEHGTIIKTTDGGDNWVSQLSGTENDFYSVFFINDSIGYIVGSYGLVLKTFNGGENWYFLNIGTEKDLTSVFFLNVNTGFITGENLMVTNDGGISWTIQKTPASSRFHSVCFTDESHGYLLGENGNIFRTSNGGGIIGIPDIDQPVTQLSVFPNPATSKIYLQAGLNGRLSLLDLEGRVIINKECRGSRVELDVSRLKCGMYFVRIQGNKGIQTAKFIKQ
jgi:photosystem II stability/assembly factor-like uncharacterized protein